MKLGKIVFISTMLILSNVVLAQSKVFELPTIIYKNDTVILDKFRVIEGSTNIQPTEGEYTIKLLSQNNVVFENSFRLGFVVHREVLTENGTIIGEEINLEKASSVLRLPFYPEATKLEVYHSNKLIFQHEIELCNSNKVCESNAGENYLSCPSDCNSGSKDDYCDKVLDGICDADCSVKELDIDCTCGNNICEIRESSTTCPKDCEKEKSNLTTFIIVGIFIVLVPFLIYLKKKPSKHNKS